MPIDVPFMPCDLTRDEYHEMDYRVMAAAFDVHNRWGCLHDEAIYQAELVRQLTAAGMQIAWEVPVKVSLDSFSKTYFMDVVVDRSVVYELKAVHCFSPQHRNQLLNYLMLCGMGWGKLVNFGAPRVESEYITSSVAVRQRWESECDDSRWPADSPVAVRFRELVIRMVNEWGCFLDFGLFYEAVVHFFGGAEAVCQRVDCFAEDGSPVGSEVMPLLDEHTTFHISARKAALGNYGEHLRRKLIATRLTSLLWVNFAGHSVTLQSIAQ